MKPERTPNPRRGPNRHGPGRRQIREEGVLPTRPHHVGRDPTPNNRHPRTKTQSRNRNQAPRQSPPRNSLWRHPRHRRFEVIDLGVDVPKEKFIEKIKETNPDVVALSGFLTLAYDSMKETVEEIKKAGLRDRVKIMIGGGQIDETIREYVGADAYGKDAVEAVAIAKKWVGA
ncbi:MAG: cobalamin B12-binding domain-containing protein [Candidatus Freyarchaeota archaeon]